MPKRGMDFRSVENVQQNKEKMRKGPQRKKWSPDASKNKEEIILFSAGNICSCQGKNGMRHEFHVRPMPPPFAARRTSYYKMAGPCSSPINQITFFAPCISQY